MIRLIARGVTSALALVLSAALGAAAYGLFHMSEGHDTFAASFFTFLTDGFGVVISLFAGLVFALAIAALVDAEFPTFKDDEK